MMRLGEVRPAHHLAFPQTETLSYFDELCKAMAMLSDHGAVFLGQSVKDGGTAMSTTLRDVPVEKLIELPVVEALQMGMCTGISIAGGLPVCVYPRINFMLLAISDLVNHLDKYPMMGTWPVGTWNPRVIIRTAIATDKPLNPGVQHLGDYSDAIQSMLSTIKVVKLNRPEDIMHEYHAALDRNVSTILVERLELYNG